MDDEKEKHAKSQRKHAAKLKKKGIPRSDDLARGVLEALRIVCRHEMVPTDQAETFVSPFVARATRELEARGFKRRHVIERYVRTLFPDDPILLSDGRRINRGFDKAAIIERIEKVLLQEDEALRRESEKTGDQSAC